MQVNLLRGFRLHIKQQPPSGEDATRNRQVFDLQFWLVKEKTEAEADEATKGSNCARPGELTISSRDDGLWFKSSQSPPCRFSQTLWLAGFHMAFAADKTKLFAVVLLRANRQELARFTCQRGVPRQVHQLRPWNGKCRPTADQPSFSASSAMNFSKARGSSP